MANWFCDHRNQFPVFKSSDSNVQTLNFCIANLILGVYQN